MRKVSDLKVYLRSTFILMQRRQRMQIKVESLKRLEMLYFCRKKKSYWRCLQTKRWNFFVILFDGVEFYGKIAEAKTHALNQCDFSYKMESQYIVKTEN